MESELAIKRQMVEQQASQITEQSAEIQRLKSTLKDFHSRVMKLDRYTKHQTETLKETVDAKILEQANRIQQVTETFKDALMLSNKTYFLEEITKQKQEKKQLKRELAVLKDTVRLTDDQVA